MHAVIETPSFLQDARVAGLSEQDRQVIIQTISENPLAGDLMPGTGGARKLRFAAPGKGKRGGYRTVHYFAGNDVPIFLLAVLKKGERSDLSQAEKNTLRKELGSLAADYRTSVKSALKRRR
ncbi:MAG: type II toxin-antitoxin system RelE/ParE family toxin [Xanthobacteraceae bacterium]